MPTGTVYGLLDPDTHALRYVGWSFEPRRRLKRERLDAAKGGTAPLHGWLRSLGGKRAPVLTVLEVAVPEAELPARERHWIEASRAVGADLLNVQRGGSHDPARLRANGRAGGLKAQANRRAAGRSQRPPSPEASARGGERGAVTTNARRVRCDECGHEATPGGVGAHQRATGHSGRTTLG